MKTNSEYKLEKLFEKAVLRSIDGVFTITNCLICDDRIVVLAEEAKHPICNRIHCVASDLVLKGNLKLK